MKLAKALLALTVAYAICMQSAVTKEADPSKSGSYSDMFSYTLVFHPTQNSRKEHFEATLVNITDRILEVQLNDKAFHSTIEITDKNGKKIRAFIEPYRTLLCTSTWDEPFVNILPKKSITWTVTLESLITADGEPVTYDLIAGKTIVSEMLMAVIPKDRSYASNNATQRSRPIIILKNG